MQTGAAGVRFALAKLRNTHTEGKNSFGNVSAFNMSVYVYLHWSMFVSTRISSARSVDLDGGLEIQLKIFIAKGETVFEKYTT